MTTTWPAMWMCPGCGSITNWGRGPVYSSMPNTICNCGTNGAYHQMVPNYTAQLLEDSFERYHEEQRASRARVEEELKDWPL